MEYVVQLILIWSYLNARYHRVHLGSAEPSTT